MSLRSRLVASMSLLLIAIVMILGASMIRANRSVLISQIDDELTSYTERGARQAGRRGNPIGFGFLPDRQAVALLRFDATGDAFVAVPSGYEESPDPLPDVSNLSPPDNGTYLTTLAAVDGSGRYRAIVFEEFEGTTTVVAVPLAEVEEAIGSMFATTIAVAAIVAVVGGAATWLIVTRSLRPVEDMVGTAQRIAAGDLTSRVAMSESATELSRLGRALNDMLGHIQHAFDAERETQRRLQQFVADASHELRTPLTAVSGYMELYEKGALGGDELDAAVSRIRREATRMSRLVDDMLLLAKLDQEPSAETRTIDLMAVLRDAATDHRAIDPTRPVSVVGPTNVTLAAEEGRMAQVLANLFSNARQHTPEGTNIVVTVVAEEADISIEFADDGPGLPDEEVDQIFDRFYRTDHSRTRSTGGSGLGLAIVGAIVERHGGSVTAGNSETGGAVFGIRLPRNQPALVDGEPNASSTESENAGQYSSDHAPKGRSVNPTTAS